MTFKVKDKVLIIHDGRVVGEGEVINVNDFREPEFKYAVDVLYDDVLFFGEKDLIKKQEEE